MMEAATVVSFLISLVATWYMGWRYVIGAFVGILIGLAWVTS